MGRQTPKAHPAFTWASGYLSELRLSIFMVAWQLLYPPIPKSGDKWEVLEEAQGLG